MELEMKSYESVMGNEEEAEKVFRHFKYSPEMAEMLFKEDREPPKLPPIIATEPYPVKSYFPLRTNPSLDIKEEKL